MTFAKTGARILIVDDSITDIQILYEAFREVHEIFVATSGEEALRRVADNPPDLILLDVVMPGMNGRDVCLRLKAEPVTADIPVIFITARGDEHHEAEAFFLGAADYITKPYNLVVVKARVNAVLRLKKEMDLRVKLAAKLQRLNDRLEEKVHAQVSQLQVAHEKIRASERLMSLALENINDLVFITDEGGRFTSVLTNPATVLGYSKAAFQSKGNVRAFLGKEPIFLEGLDASGEIRNIESTLIDSEGLERVFLITVKRVAIDDGTILWTCRDIDERKNLEKRLHQAHKMEAIGTLAGGIAHDFNNILGVITGQAELIEMFDIDADSPVQRRLKEIIQASERARELVQQILTISRQRELPRTPVDMVPLLKEVIKFMRASAPATIELQQHIAVEKATVLSDTSQIHQILMNLCTNAVHAMAETGGTLDIELTTTELDVATAISQYPPLSAASYIVIKIADTGPGMTAEVLEKIFEPYFTTQKDGKGTGLGLAVVDGIVRNHEGHIHVASEVGTGSVFQVMLPQITADALEIETGTTNPIQYGDETILLVDDEDLLLETARQLLENLGYKVSAQKGPLEALEAFRAQPDRFDLVITDLTMPCQTGVELYRDLRQIRPDVAVILCSGFGKGISEKTAKKDGFKAFLYKPLETRMLSQTIRRILDAIE